MNRAATLPDVDQLEGRGGGGTAVPGGRSVWDLETPVSGAESEPPSTTSPPLPDPPASPSRTVADRIELGSEDEVEAARRATPPRERDAAPHTGTDVPESPVSQALEDARRRNRIGLLGVLFVIGLVIAAGVWFLGADADGAQRERQPPAATLPGVEGNLDALANFTERSTDATNDQPEVADDPEASATDSAAIAPEPIEDAEPIATAPVELAPVEPALVAPAPAEPSSTEAPESPAEPIDMEPAVESAEVGAVTPAPAAPGQAGLAAPVSGDPAQDGPRVEITTRVEPCRFGSSCLIAGFVMHGFETAPQEFICEFASGSRFTFRATSQTVDHACATGSLGDSITIEIAGVRSTTVVHQ